MRSGRVLVVVGSEGRRTVVGRMVLGCVVLMGMKEMGRRRIVVIRSLAVGEVRHIEEPVGRVRVDLEAGIAVVAVVEEDSVAVDGLVGQSRCSSLCLTLWVVVVRG